MKSIRLFHQNCHSVVMVLMQKRGTGWLAGSKGPEFRHLYDSRDLAVITIHPSPSTLSSQCSRKRMN